MSQPGCEPADREQQSELGGPRCGFLARHGLWIEETHETAPRHRLSAHPDLAGRRSGSERYRDICRRGGAGPAHSRCSPWRSTMLWSARRSSTVMSAPPTKPGAGRMAASASSPANSCQPPVTDGRPFVMVDPEGRPLRITTSSAAALISEMLMGIGLSAAPGAGLPTTSRTGGTGVASGASAVDANAAVSTEICACSAGYSADIKPIIRHTTMMAPAIALAKFLLPVSGSRVILAVARLKAMSSITAINAARPRPPPKPFKKPRTGTSTTISTRAPDTG